MIDILIWAITITGIISLVLIAAKALSKEENGWLILLQKINNITIKIGSLSAIFLLVYIYYQFSEGVISVQAIGFYIACGSIFFSLIKDANFDSKFIDNISTVVSSKVQALHKNIAEQAEQAKKKKEEEAKSEQKINDDSDQAR